MTFISYSQNFEDVMLWRALKHVPQGFWIDVGAAHPDEYSVTRAFSDHGWCGINIEANPPYVARIAGARPRDVTLAVAAGAGSGSVHFFEVVGTGMSTMELDIAEQHRSAGYEVREHQVPLRTLASICAEHAPADIHFLKIDVEGAERDVLAGADFANHRPWIVLVEATQPNSQVQTHATWEPLLLAASYRFVWFDGLNRFYVAAEHWDELAPAFTAPPNVFDGFIRAADTEHLNRILGAETRAGQAEARAAQAGAQAAQANARAAQAEDSAAREAAQAAAATAHADEMEARLAQLLSSTSWRVTGPIRAVGELKHWRVGLALREIGMEQFGVQRLWRVAGEAHSAVRKARRAASHLVARAASRIPSIASTQVQLGHSARASDGSRCRRVAWVTTWNVKCGIAAAAAHLIGSLPQEDVVVYAAHQKPRLGPDAENCHRIWRLGKDLNGLSAILAKLERDAVGALVIHFNYGLYNHAELSAFIEAAVARGMVVVMELHSTVDPSKDDPNQQLAGLISGLRKCHRLLAHSPVDMDRLKALGLIDNVALFPLGIIAGSDRPVATQRNRHGTLLASFGFCLPNKGLPELVEAIGLLRGQGAAVRLLMLNAQYPRGISADEVRKVQQTIQHLGLEQQIELRTDYLPDEECLLLLQEASLIVNPYQATGEAASAAARFSLASGSPVLVTPIPIFDDLGEAVFRMPGISPADMAQGIVETLHHLEQEHETPRYRAVRAAAEEWRKAHDFRHQGAVLMEMIRGLSRDLKRERA